MQIFCGNKIAFDMPSHRIPENLRHLSENEDKQNLQGHNQKFILIIGFTWREEVL